MSNHDRVVENHDQTVVNGKAGYNISWRAVLAGVVTFIAVSILLSLVSVAIGFGVPDLTSAEPFAGVTTGVLAWTVFSIVVALAAAGYVAGLTANRAGFVHGFLTWATSLIVLVWLTTSAVASLFGFVGNVLGTVGNVAADAASTVVESAGSLTQSAFDSIVENVSIDTSELDGTVEDVLSDTEIEELQPEYLQGQIDATIEDVKDAGYAIVVDGQDAGTIIQGVADNIEERINQIGQELDREAIETAIANNSELSQSEVNDAVDNIISAYEEVSAQASSVLSDIEGQLNQLLGEVSQAVEEGAEQATQVAEDATNEISKYALWLLLGLVVGLLVTTYAGRAGSEATWPYS